MNTSSRSTSSAPITLYFAGNLFNVPREAANGHLAVYLPFGNTVVRIHGVSASDEAEGVEVVCTVDDWAAREGSGEYYCSTSSAKLTEAGATYYVPFRSRESGKRVLLADSGIVVEMQGFSGVEPKRRVIDRLGPAVMAPCKLANEWLTFSYTTSHDKGGKTAAVLVQREGSYRRLGDHLLLLDMLRRRLRDAEITFTDGGNEAAIVGNWGTTSSYVAMNITTELAPADVGSALKNAGFKESRLPGELLSA